MNTDKNHINVALIGFERITNTLVQGVVQHAKNGNSLPSRFPDIGGYTAKSIRFSSVFSLTGELDTDVGQKLSTISVRRKDINPGLIGESVLSSYLESIGGNPNTDTSEMLMGGQNPILRNVPYHQTEDEDSVQIEYNEEGMQSILTGDDGNDTNPYRKTDFALISLPDNAEYKSHVRISKIINLLEELDIPHYVLYPTSGVKLGQTVNYDVSGQVSNGFLTKLVGGAIAEQGMKVSHMSHRTVDLGDRTRVEGYAEVEGFGGVSSQISFAMNFNEDAAKASYVLDILRFMVVAKELKLTGQLCGVETLYTNQNTMPRGMSAEEECEAIASRNLMGLGQFYTADGEYFVHK